MRKLVVLLVALTVCMAPAAAFASKCPKVDICVTEQGKVRTVSVSKNAESAFLKAHPGSYLGKCSTGDTPGDNPSPVPTPAVDVRTEDGIFLCYSSTQTTPVVFAKPQAALLVANNGYVEAQAVVGNVEGGNNVGSYHLVCNAPGSDTHTAVSDEGAVYGVDYGPQYEELGFYQIFA